jgi:hypothetical protein
MKVSRPQFLVYPEAKCGKPAAIVANKTDLFVILSESGGKSAVRLVPISAMLPRDNSLTNSEPFLMNKEDSDQIRDNINL